MDAMKGYRKSFLVNLLLALGTACPLASAQSLDQLIDAAKKEPELTFIAGAGAFGGPKAIADLESGVNKKFGLNARIRILGRSGNERYGSAGYYRTEERRQGVYRHLSRLAIAFLFAAS